MTAELSRLHSEGQRLPFRQPDGSEVPPQWFVEQMAALSPLAIEMGSLSARWMGRTFRLVHSSGKKMLAPRWETLLANRWGTFRTSVGTARASGCSRRELCNCTPAGCLGSSE